MNEVSDMGGCQVTDNGFTGTDDNMATVRSEERRWHLPCSCGGAAWIWEYGSMYQHSEPVDPDAEHIISPFWREEVWRYELVE